MMNALGGATEVVTSVSQMNNSPLVCDGIFYQSMRVGRHTPTGVLLSDDGVTRPIAIRADGLLCHKNRFFIPAESKRIQQ